jgi:hypothetical protein
MSVKKQKAYEELREKAAMLVYGVRISDETASLSGAGVTVKETVRDGRSVPFYFISPSGLHVMIHPSEDSAYAIEHENGRFSLTKNGAPLYDDISFEPRPLFYDLQTTDGKNMKDVGILLSDGCLEVWYSNRCAFRAHNEECMFCDINTRPPDLFPKTAARLAETAKAAFTEGVARRVDFTGGVIGERREIANYCEAIEAIREALGVDEVTSSACVAAPRDFDNIARLKAAGFTSVTLNMEIWDENIFKTVCPGKQRITGRERWIEALRFAAQEFGFGHVRCNFVTGIEPKHKTLEGIEYLAGFGVVGNPNIFNPRPGTPFEGTRCPTPEWNLDLQEKAYNIMRKNGLTFEQVKGVHAETNGLHHDIWRIEEERLPVFA